MCIAAPGKVLNVSDGYARVDLGKEKKEVRADLFKTKPGDWVLVFGNQIIDIISKERAKELIQSMVSL